MEDGAIMIRFVHCVRRRSDVSLEDFRAFWSSKAFNTLLEELALSSGAVRWSTSLTLEIDVNIELMKERASEEPFDAMLEIWWERAKGLLELLDSAENQRLLDAMEACQEPYIDFKRSRRFFTEWEDEAASDTL
jgi:hypothetical protein